MRTRESEIMDSRPSLRNVLEFAHEVRVYLRNAKVIFGSTVPGAGPDQYFVMPWGTHSVVTVRLDEVMHAVPVHAMTWLEHQAICSAQRAGVFARPSRSVALPGARRCDVVTSQRETMACYTTLMTEHIVSIMTANSGWVAEYEGPASAVPIICWALVEGFDTKRRRVVGLVDGSRTGQSGIVPVEPNPGFLRYRHRSPTRLDTSAELPAIDPQPSSHLSTHALACNGPLETMSPLVPSPRSLEPVPNVRGRR